MRDPSTVPASYSIHLLCADYWCIELARLDYSIHTFCVDSKSAESVDATSMRRFALVEYYSILFMPRPTASFEGAKSNKITTKLGTVYLYGWIAPNHCG